MMTLDGSIIDQYTKDIPSAKICGTYTFPNLNLISSYIVSIPQPLGLVMRLYL